MERPASIKSLAVLNYSSQNVDPGRIDKFLHLFFNCMEDMGLSLFSWKQADAYDVKGMRGLYMKSELMKGRVFSQRENQQGKTKDVSALHSRQQTSIYPEADSILKAY